MFTMFNDYSIKEVYYTIKIMVSALLVITGLFIGVLATLLTCWSGFLMGLIGIAIIIVLDTK